MPFIRICSCSNEVEAGMVVSILQEAGFNPLDYVKSPHVSLGGIDANFFAEVPEGEAEQARIFLHEFGVTGVLSN
jgi:hypothetical protein